MKLSILGNGDSDNYEIKSIDDLHVILNGEEIEISHMDFAIVDGRCALAVYNDDMIPVAYVY